MRIKKISIFGLFDMFNHEIPLNQAEHITILYGMNGMGKTTVFKIVDAFFNIDDKKLIELPFKKAIIELDNEEVFEILKEAESVTILNAKIGYINFNKNGGSLSNGKAEEIKDAINQIKTYFIETQRLILVQNKISSYWRHSNILSHIVFSENISNCNSDFLALIEDIYRERNDLLNSLRFTLSDRVANGEIRTDYTKEQLLAEIHKVNETVEKLKSIGLMLDSFNGYSWATDDLNPVKMAIFAVDVQDAQKTLSIFDAIYSKLVLLLEIINERRFVFKKISVHVQKGFIITNEKGEILPLTQLSAGEQNELILLYFLLFKIPANSLIMIDEPEISLHIDWQHEFIQDMEEIIKLRGFDLMLATHSPDIVNGRSELTVSLNKHEIESLPN